MKLLLAMIGFVAGLACFPALAASDPACQQADIATCPSFFAGQCTSDAAFQKQNASACMKILAGHAVDNANCAGLEKKPCLTPTDIKKCADITDPLDRFFCEQGHSDCPRSIRVIKSGYDKVLEEFNNALSVYQPVLDLDLGKVDDMNKLCSYSLDQLKKFRALAEQDNQGLKRFDGELRRLEICGDTVQAFLGSGKPPEILQQLWEQIKNTQQEGLKQVAERKGALKTKQERLNHAPSQIGQLTIPYRLACPDTPPAAPLKQGQMEKKQ